MSNSLPDSPKSFVDEEVSKGAYSTSSEYVDELIRKDADRLHLRSLLLQGAQSGPGGTADAAYFESLRERVQRAARR